LPAISNCINLPNPDSKNGYGKNDPFVNHVHDAGAYHSSVSQREKASSKLDVGHLCFRRSINKWF
jgi:hypothetical protein